MKASECDRERARHHLTGLRQLLRWSDVRVGGPFPSLLENSSWLEAVGHGEFQLGFEDSLEGGAWARGLRLAALRTAQLMMQGNDVVLPEPKATKRWVSRPYLWECHGPEAKRSGVRAPALMGCARLAREDLLANHLADDGLPRLPLANGHDEFDPARYGSAASQNDEPPRDVDARRGNHSPVHRVRDDVFPSRVSTDPRSWERPPSNQGAWSLMHPHDVDVEHGLRRVSSALEDDAEGGGGNEDGHGQRGVASQRRRAQRQAGHNCSAVCPGCSISPFKVFIVALVLLAGAAVAVTVALLA